MKWPKLPGVLGKAMQLKALWQTKILEKIKVNQRRDTPSNLHLS
jgi:hypothetical protein